MNTKQIDHPTRLKLSKKMVYSKDKRPESLKNTLITYECGSFSEKQLLSRLDELEKRNSSLELLVERRNSKLLEIISTNGKFLSIIAHDLRSPFSSILGILELLKLSLKEFNKDEIEEYINMVYNSANNTLVLLDNLLEWALSQNIEKSFKPVKINLYELLREEIDSLKTLAGQKQILLSHTIEPGLNATADLQMVKTILRNLISNAIKYTNTDGKIVVTALQNKHFVEITVTDNGIGISDEERKKLFKIEAFHSTPGTNNEKGTGLGLMLCKEFVELHGGDFKIESEEGKGSRFAFTIPQYA